MAEDYNSEEWYEITNEQVRPNDFRTDEFEAGLTSIGITDFTMKSGDIVPVMEMIFDDNGPSISFFPPKSLDPEDIQGYMDIGRIANKIKEKGIVVKFKRDFSAMICIPDITGSIFRMIPKIQEVKDEGNDEVKKYTHWDCEIVELKTGSGKVNNDTVPESSVTLEDVKGVIYDFMTSKLTDDGTVLPVRSVDIIKHIKTTVDVGDQPAYNKMRDDALKGLSEEGLISSSKGIYSVVV